MSTYFHDVALSRIVGWDRRTPGANALNQQPRTVNKESALGGAVTLKKLQCYEMSQEHWTSADRKVKLSLCLIN
jgi:hypothetical protein